MKTFPQYLLKQNTITLIKLGVYFIILKSNCSDNYHKNYTLVSKLWCLKIPVKPNNNENGHIKAIEEARNKILNSKNGISNIDFYFKLLKFFKFIN